MRSLQIIQNCRGTVTNKLYVLDSSFNPPTLAHKALLDTMQDGSQLLLFSSKNVDKLINPSDIENRIKLIKIIAKGGLIGITDQARVRIRI